MTVVFSIACVGLDLCVSKTSQKIYSFPRKHGSVTNGCKLKATSGGTHFTFMIVGERVTVLYNEHFG